MTEVRQRDTGLKALLAHRFRSLRLGCRYGRSISGGSSRHGRDRAMIQIFIQLILQVAYLFFRQRLPTFILSTTVTHSVHKPVNSLVSTMSLLEEGDTEVKVPARERSNEVSQIAQPMEVVKKLMIKSNRLADEAVEHEKLRHELCENTANRGWEPTASASSDRKSRRGSRRHPFQL